MRELSETAALHQAEQYLAWAGKKAGPVAKVGGDTFAAWVYSKDLSADDREAVRRLATWLLMGGR